jgi:hypothetical protein
VHPHLQRDIADVLVQRGTDVRLDPPPPEQGSLEPPSTDTICAWLGAAQNGDTTALANLFHLQNHIQVWCLFFIAAQNDVIHLFSLQSAGGATERPNITLTPPQSSLRPQPSARMELTPAPQPAITMESLNGQADLLRTCNVDIQALETANGLRDVISQVESGQVRMIRDLYGPKSTKSTTPVTVKWKNIKGSITKRERIYDQLMTQFNGDKARFFDFFTIRDTSTVRKRKRKAEGGELRAMRKVVEAIPHCMADVTSEMRKPQYLDSSGQFSGELWAQHWAGKNHWEVWRELGKEQY